MRGGTGVARSALRHPSVFARWVFPGSGFEFYGEFARYDVEGKQWIIEGHGVDPDIVVENDPATEYAGKDQQLEKGIAVILERV